MIHLQGKDITGAHLQGKVITKAYLALKEVWSLVSSCFGSGFWVNDLTWSNEDTWVN